LERSFPDTIGKSIQPRDPRAKLVAAERARLTGRKAQESGQFPIIIGPVEDNGFGLLAAHSDLRKNDRAYSQCRMIPADTSEWELHFLNDYHSYEALPDPAREAAIPAGFAVRATRW
jgi:hypothetical protein